VVERVDDKDLQVVLRKNYALKIPRNHVAWDQQNMRWEASLWPFLKPIYRLGQRIELVPAQRRIGGWRKSEDEFILQQARKV
jgi:hypothetical protein